MLPGTGLNPPPAENAQHTGPSPHAWRRTAPILSVKSTAKEMGNMAKSGISNAAHRISDMPRGQI